MDREEIKNFIENLVEAPADRVKEAFIHIIDSIEALEYKATFGLVGHPVKEIGASTVQVQTGASATLDAGGSAPVASVPNPFNPDIDVVSGGNSTPTT